MLNENYNDLASSDITSTWTSVINCLPARDEIVLVLGWSGQINIDKFIKDKDGFYTFEKRNYVTHWLPITQGKQLPSSKEINKIKEILSSRHVNKMYIGYGEK